MDSLAERLAQGVTIDDVQVDEVSRVWIVEGYSNEEHYIESVCEAAGALVAQELRRRLQPAVEAKAMSRKESLERGYEAKGR